MISLELIASIKKHEGEVKENGRHIMYQCPADKPTIGYGHNLEYGISDSVAEILLMEDIETVIKELHVRVGSLTQHSQNVRDVLYEMAFNMGVPRLMKFELMWKALKFNFYHVAGDEMLDSRWAKQVGQRAEVLAERMRQG